MIIAVNGFYFRHNATGIANMMISAINEFSTHQDIKIILLCSRSLPKEILENLKMDKITVIIKKPWFIPDIGMLWFLFYLPILVNRIRPDIFWCPAVWMPFFIDKKVKTLITIHDYVSKEYKKTMRLSNRFFSFFLEKRSINKATFIWTVSEYTKEKTIFYYPYRRSNQIFVGEAPDDFYKKTTIQNADSDILKKKYHIFKSFILYVGTLEPRKNVEFLFNLFKLINEKYNYQIVIVGIKGWGKTRIQEIMKAADFPSSDVILTGFISRQELLILYNIAQCFISTSINEGLGLPQLEAMFCSCPVISPHNSAMIEVVAGAGVTVLDWEFDNWMKKIDWLLKNRNEVIIAQNARIKKYNWKIIISSLIDYIGR
jgi:glycosyltransferase involved in cell wall biosynthesis